MNLLSTLGSFLIAVSFLIWVYNVVRSRKNPHAGADPWDGRTLEWATSSPPPVHNFDVEPTAGHLDEWWHEKYDENEDGRPVRREHFTYLSEVDEASLSRGGRQPVGVDVSAIHLPSPSYWPIVMALGLPLVSYGLLYTYWLSGLGALLIIGGIVGMGLEPSVDPEAGHDDHDDHDPGHEPDDGEEAELVSVGAGDAAGEPDKTGTATTTEGEPT
jgi:cytochrome c oxidase subunit 1